MFNRLWPNLRYALLGLKLAWRDTHFRVHSAAALAVAVVAYFFNVSGLEFAVLLLASGFVIVAEMFNTALEELCDKHTREHDPHIARIKDLAAAAVLLAACFAVLVGLVIFLPYVLHYVNG